MFRCKNRSMQWQRYFYQTWPVTSIIYILAIIFIFINHTTADNDIFTSINDTITDNITFTSINDTIIDNIAFTSINNTTTDNNIFISINDTDTDSNAFTSVSDTTTDSNIFISINDTDTDNNNSSANFTASSSSSSSASNLKNTKSSFTVYRLNPRTMKQSKFLLDLVNNTRLDFWKRPRAVNGQVHVMIEGSMKCKFLELMMQNNISYSVMIDDVEKKIRKLRESANKTFGNNWLRDVPMTRGINFNLAKYHSYQEIINYLNQLAARYPNIVKVRNIGITHENRQIALIKIGKAAQFKKPGIWIDGGIHAREWVAPATVLYIINQLVTRYDRDPQIQRFVDEMDWFIVPVLNPDGYEYTRSSTHPEIRLWRKNRSPPVCQISQHDIFSQSRQECCQGVDLNRNYDWQYGIEGSSSDPCSEIYHGRFAFSEPETKAVHNFIFRRRRSIKTFLTFHSYSQILMYPFGHRERTYSSDVNDLRDTALRAANALRAAYGTIYTVGTGADTLYPASGGAEDWAKGRMGVKYSYLFELRPEETVWDGFLLDESEIIPTAREAFEAVKVIASRTNTMFPPKDLSSSRVTINSFAPTTACTDSEQFCTYWARNGYCTSWPIMRKVCARSCGFCTQ
ncbi:Carboxypeptidase A1 [Dirofilaria immitis]|nr:Carboxypeptidase A1 [Dirofilaria immitis]